ncbi:hypothetical protein Tco_0654176 [Tanacetum coccineum]|uniref:Uncharacterized protein n=1 Tax=Tanacetum coccineum TaxID=301880 RepID=A0ABQ4X2Q1_9ASTR
MAGEDDQNINNQPPNPPPPTQQAPHTVSTIKLPILKKGEYDIWSMKMEHYLAHTNNPVWEVIQNGNGLVSISTDTQGQIKILPPKSAEEILARERERKARTTLLMALPEDHLANFLIYIGILLMEKGVIGPVTQKMNRRTMLSWLAIVQVQTQRIQIPSQQQSEIASLKRRRSKEPHKVEKTIQRGLTARSKSSGDKDTG